MLFVPLERKDKINLYIVALRHVSDYFNVQSQVYIDLLYIHIIILFMFAYDHQVKSVSMYFVILVIWSRATASQNKLKPLSFLAMIISLVLGLTRNMLNMFASLTLI